MPKRDFPGDIHVDLGDLEGTIRESLEGVKTTLQSMGLGPMEEDDSDEETVKELVVGPDSELSVHSHDGSIVVQAGESSTIRVHATGQGPRFLGSPEIMSDGRRVTVRTRGGGPLSVDYHISVPRDCSVSVNTVKADVSVEGTHAPVQIQTIEGDVTVEDVLARCAITTVGGDVTGTGLQGPITVGTTNGDVDITASRLESFRLESMNGDFRVETPLAADGTYTAKTVNGDLHLLLPPGSGATVRLRTTHGEVESELPTEVISAGRRYWEGRIDGGGPVVEMESVNGDVQVSRGSDPGMPAPPPPAESPSPVEDQPATSTASVPSPPIDVSDAPEANEPPAPPAASVQEASQERDHDAASILSALERGEITVDEAMAKLDSLE